MALTPALLSLPVLSGLFFAFIGIAYRQGQRRGLETSHIVLHMGLWGTVFFAVVSQTAQWSEAPASVFGLGVLGGITQWLTILLVGVALRLGPLSPVWCALNLTFLPVTLYSAVAFGEPLTAMKTLGLVLAVLSVGIASLEVHEAPHGRSAGWHRVVYGLLLAALLLLNCVMHVSIKHLGTVAITEGMTLMAAFGPVYFTSLYVALLTPIAGTQLWRHDRRSFGRPGWTWGSVAALGSIGGVGFLGASAALPGAVVFTLSAIISLLGAGLASVTVFGEKLSVLWVAMMVTAVASVVLVSL